MKKIFSYLLPKERIMRITYNDFLFKWEVDIIERPDEHFKAADDRRFGVYNYHYQSIDQIEQDPWHQEIPKEVHNEIKKFIKENLTKEDRELSKIAESEQTYYVWAPVDQDKQ